MYYYIVIDSFGIGADRRAAEYDDCGAHTAYHVSRAVPGPKWKFLQRLGLGNCCRLTDPAVTLEGCPPAKQPIASFGAMEKISPGKDTLSGHWELAGMQVNIRLSTFPQEYPSFPESLIRELKEASGRDVIGNRAASGTVIIQELGAEQIESGALICYTSADSVLQIAAHEAVIPLEELYEICEKARRISDRYQIGRVIARPFIGTSEDGFVRTKNRRDYSIALPGPTYLEKELPGLGLRVIGVGKIGDIFNEKGIAISYHDKGNEACLNRTIALARDAAAGQNDFVFVNLVDTDMLYGHRRDAAGYCAAVSDISERLQELYGQMKPGDRLCVTADHGCDPCYKGTDHTREYVPFLIAEKGGPVPGKNLGRRCGFGYAMAYTAGFADETVCRAESGEGKGC